MDGGGDAADRRQIFLLPIFLRNKIYTMPEFLQRRYGSSVRFVMAVFWLGLYIL